MVATAFCRLFANKDIRVSPFKAQNMSNNSGVTPEGLEMGRAQIVQAEAAKQSPHVDMNPILLKPTSDVGSQVVVLGKAVRNSTASEYHQQKDRLFSTACRAYDRLRDQNDLIVLEGAGSCAEVNLMANDIVNFRMADYADVPVVLVADIHRGGVFAQIVGTLNCLPESHQKRIIGFIINRFRGDIHLFKDGVNWIEKQTGKPVFGVLPWFDHFRIDSEDSVSIEQPRTVSPRNIVDPAVAVIRLPHISNFTDFLPLSRLDGLDVYFLEKVQSLQPFKAIILPGSKNTRFDLGWLQRSGWDQMLQEYVNQGGHVLGICGGYQMMGRWVHDPQGLEGKPGTSRGLDLLPVETTLKSPKTTTLTRFRWKDAHGHGYEIHMGQTQRHDGQPFFQVLSQNRQSCRKEDGCITAGDRLMGTYIHGLFDNPIISRKWLSTIGVNGITFSTSNGYDAKQQDYEFLADHFKRHVDVTRILKTAFENR